MFATSRWLSARGAAGSRALRGFDDVHSLAALRIAVALLILISPELYQAEALAAQPQLLEFVPEGAAWLAALHLTPGAAHVLKVVALSSGALALLGFHARAALAVLTCSALPLYALSQLSGTVLHDMHLFWFSALLAFSPCADVWALDSDSRGKTPARGAREYTLPAQLGRALLGVVYFFPGLHKLLASGWSWGAAPHVIAQMHAKWFELAEVPWLRIDHFGVVSGEITLTTLSRYRITGVPTRMHVGARAFPLLLLAPTWYASRPEQYTWTSSNGSVASIVQGQDGRPTLTALSQGKSTISALLGSVLLSAEVLVSDVVLQSIQSRPAQRRFPTTTLQPLRQSAATRIKRLSISRP